MECFIMNWCWIRGHKWKIISHWNYYDMSCDDQVASNSVTLQCQKCGNVKVKQNYAGGFIDENGET